MQGSSFYWISDNVFFDSDGFKMDCECPFRSARAAATIMMMGLPGRCLFGADGGHGSKFWNNLVITKSDRNGDCMGLGGFEAGFGDEYYNNTCALPGAAGLSGNVGGRRAIDVFSSSPSLRARGMTPLSPRGVACLVAGVSGCEPDETAMHDNKYFTTFGNATLRCGGGSYAIGDPALLEKGMEVGSTSGVLPTDEELVAWAKARLP